MSTVRARPARRHALMVAAAVAFAATSLAALGTGERARATSGGNPYEAPLVVDTNPAPDVVETTLVADETVVDIGNGVTAKAFTYNGAIPGPEFRLTVGQTVIVHLENRLDASYTSIHWHGIELNNASDGTPVTQNEIPPGGTYRYEFEVIRPGVYWYHPHFEGSTNQVFRGLEGSIYVTDDLGAESRLQADGVLPPPAQTRTLLLGDTTVCKAPGTNDLTTYPNDPNLPWAGGPPGTFTPQGGPHPVDLCERNPVDDHGDPRPAGAFGAGEIPNVWGPPLANAPEGQTVLTNGRNVGGRAGSPEAPGALSPGASTFPLRPGTGVRLQLVNGAHSRYFRLRLTDSAGAQIPLVRVGGEGGLLDRAVLEGGTPAGFDTKHAVGEIVIGPSERADVVAAIPATASGVATLWTLDLARLGGGFSRIPTVPVMHLDVSGAPATPAYSIQGSPPDTPAVPGTPLLAAPQVNHPVQPLDAATGTLLDPVTFAPTKPGSALSRIRMTPGTAATYPFPWGIDGVPGPHDSHDGYAETPRIQTTRYGRLGDIIDLSVENATTVHHPFHFHGFSFQPIRFELTAGGGPDYVFPYNEFVDAVDVPPGYTLHYRVLVEDRPLQDGATPGGGYGRWMFHCHIFPHQSGGLMSEFIVVRPDGNERPNLDTPTTSVTTSIGKAVSVTGKISDPDADPVALRASVGAVTDNGNGTWTWTYTPQNRPDENQVVYITARDSEGLESQASFALSVAGVLGYRLVGGDGGIFSFGRAFHGSTGGVQLNQPIVGGATSPAGFDGYWTVASDGGVFAFNAPFLGSLGGQAISAPAVAMEATSTGRGYWIVLADGTVRAFGDARHAGDLAGRPLNRPVTAMAATSSGQGYWLVAEDGGIFGFGDAGFFGSAGGTRLNAPVVDLAPAPDGLGYLLTAADGGVFTYGSAAFKGSTGGIALNAPVVAMRAAPAGLGYWLAAADGGVFTFGSIPFLGSVGGMNLNAPMLDIIG
jgi:FtsP/CotA-like multicopper oxidase with cupredoxin domain